MAFESNEMKNTCYVEWSSKQHHKPDTISATTLTSNPEQYKDLNPNIALFTTNKHD